MQRTRLGISVGMMAAIAYVATGFFNLTASLLILGYVLMMEGDVWLRRTVVKSTVICVCFTILIAVIDLIPGALDILSSFIAIFNRTGVPFYIINGFFNFLSTVVNFCEDLIYLALAGLALTQKDITIPVIDDLINKHFS